MSERPLVSVVIPTYNSADFVVEAVESVLAQEYRPIEVFVIDDGSSDDTMARLARFGPPVTAIRQEHAGPPVARNNGILRSRGEFVAFLDADDLWLPGKLERSLQPLLDDPEVGVVYTDFIMLEVATGRRYRVPTYRKSGWMTEDLFLECRGVCTPTLVVRKSEGDAIHWFDEELVRAQDWDLLVRLAERTQFHFVPEPLAIVRDHGARLSVVRRDLYRRYNLEVIERAVRRRPELFGSLRAEALSRAYFRFAMQSYADFDMGAARADLWRSLRSRWHWATFNYLLRTLLPRSWIARLRARRLERRYETDG